MRVKKIPGFDKYEITDSGKVFSYHSGSRKEVAVTVNRHRGYAYVMLHSKGRRRNVQVHRLVAGAFVANPNFKPEVNHINGVKVDNRAENLEWVSKSENVLHSNMLHPNKRNPGRMRFSREEVDNVFSLFASGITRKEIAKTSGMGYSTVVHILLKTRRSKQ